MKLRNVGIGLIVALAAALPSLGLAVIPPHQPNPLAGQAKAVADARANVERAKSQLLVIRKRVALSFESKPEYKAAKNAADHAKSSYESANHKIMSKLEKDPAYQAIIAKRDKAQAVLDSIPKKDVVSSDDAAKLSDEDINKASKERTEAALELKKLEKDAEENDPAVVAARQKYNDARQAWETMQTEVDEAMKSDPDYVPAQAAVDQAEQQYKQARESYAAAAKAARPVPAPPQQSSRHR